MKTVPPSETSDHDSSALPFRSAERLASPIHSSKTSEATPPFGGTAAERSSEKRQPARQASPPCDAASRHGMHVKSFVILVAFALFAASCLKQEARISPTITSSEFPDAVPERVSDKTFKAFSHRIEEHKQFDCTSCHKREGRVLKMDFAAHESCVGCHLNQFTNEENQAMCAICHNDLGASPPTMKTFPVNFKEGFNMKFDHAAHDNGTGRPAEGCAACHAPRGPGRAIPVGFQAHATCYACHTPESKIGSCNVCHELAPYSRTPQSRYVFKAIFSHAEHGGVGCSDCHSVRAGAPQGRQVTNIAAQQHNVAPSNNCAMCHNGSRAFSGNDVLNMASCTRCHSGPGFDMMPGSPQ